MDVLLEKAAALIRAGGVVAIPTETSYGLAVDPGNAAAVRKIFQIKKRSAHKPLLVLVSEQEQLRSLVTSIPSFYQELIEEFWPGPLTLVFEAQAGILSQLTAGTGTVGVRQTPHPMIVQLIEMLGHPITATSANLSGAPAARCAAEVRKIFPEGIDMILDGETGNTGQLSTVVRQVNGLFCIARDGLVDLKDRLPFCVSDVL